MTAFRLVLLGIGGLMFGSFLTVVVSRMPERRSIIAPRSTCPRCGTVIKARDNVPVVSYIVLGGRCRGCREPISALYPVIEAATGGLFVLVGLAVPTVWEDWVIAPFFGLLFAAAIIDIRHRIIPNRLVYSALAAFAVVLGVGGAAGAGPNLLGAVTGLFAYGGAMLLVAMAAPGGMGMGDVKLAGLIGLVLGSRGLGSVAVAAMAAVLLGGIGAVGALVAGRTRHQTIPFGPYLAAGAIVAGLFGSRLAAWYGGFLK